jgi:outer membrane receptor protein involved in Fe transport
VQQPPLRKTLCFIWFIAGIFPVLAQERIISSGEVWGNVLSKENSLALQGVTISLSCYGDSFMKKEVISNKDGSFSVSALADGWYRITLTSMGFATLKIDSIHLRPEKRSIQLSDLLLAPQASGMETIIIHAEKPQLENKDGNIIFNATESPLSAGSNAAELLKNIPLVSNDPDGKVTVRGREPRILIDDKPVEMNAQQLQDFLESMPGNMIEKIEVMTNPPAQYANEPGGVINIVTRKGKTGITGRVSLSAGTRGERSANGSFNVRKKGLLIQFNAGVGYNKFQGNGYSNRENRYTDSTNTLYTTNQYVNRSERPSARLNIEYDLNDRNTINFTGQVNQHDYKNQNEITYINENRYEEIYRISERRVISEGDNINPSANLTYTHRGKLKGEQLRLVTGYNYSQQDLEKDFYQQFFDGVKNPTGGDTAQHQWEYTGNNGVQLRMNYDKPLPGEKTTVSAGAAYLYNSSHVELNAYSVDTPSNGYVFIPLLSNDFRFTQGIQSYRLSVKQKLADKFWFSGGASLDETRIAFDLTRDNQKVNNSYLNWLPYASLNKNWDNKVNLSLVYRRTIRRPGIRELNPAIDFSDPYNIRFGNPDLLPSQAHTFDLILGKTSDKFYINGGVGFNTVEDIFAQVRTLIEYGITEITWENISGRKEYEANTWMGYTFSKKLRLNFNAGYTFNEYSEYDINVNRYRNGGSWNSRLNLAITPSTLWNFNGNINFNRFANPQGTVRSSVNMQFGMQYKMFDKRLVIALNVIDPFIQQEYRTFTEGTNFNLESYSYTQTRNYRLTLSYNFSNMHNKKRTGEKDALKEMLKTKS